MADSKFASPVSLVACVFFCLLLLDMFGSSASGSGHQSTYQQFLEHTQTERRMLLQKKEIADTKDSTLLASPPTSIPRTHNGAKRTLTSVEDLTNKINPSENPVTRGLLSQGKGKDITAHQGQSSQAATKAHSRLLLATTKHTLSPFPELPCFTKWNAKLASVGMLSGPSGTVNVSLPSPTALLLSFNVTDSYYPSSASLVFPDIKTKQGASRFPLALYGPQRYIRNASLTTQDTPSSGYFQAFVSKLSGTAEIEVVLKSTSSWATGSQTLRGKLTPQCALNKGMAPAPASASAAAASKDGQVKCSFPGFSIAYTVPASLNVTTLLLSRCHVAPESVAIATVRSSRKAFAGFTVGSHICLPKGCEKALKANTQPPLAGRSVAETGTSTKPGSYGNSKNLAAAYAPAKSKASYGDRNKAKYAAKYPLAPNPVLFGPGTKPKTAASQNRKLPKATPTALAPVPAAPTTKGAKTTKPKTMPAAKAPAKAKVAPLVTPATAPAVTPKLRPIKPSTQASKNRKVPTVKATAPAPAIELPTLQQEPVVEPTFAQTFLELGQVAPTPSPDAGNVEGSLLETLVTTVKEELGISSAIASGPTATAPAVVPTPVLEDATSAEKTPMDDLRELVQAGNSLPPVASVLIEAPLSAEREEVMVLGTSESISVAPTPAGELTPPMKAAAVPVLPPKAARKPAHASTQIKAKALKCTLSTFPKRYTIPTTCPGYLPNLLLERCGVDAEAVAYASASKTSTTSVISPGSSICVPKNCDPCAVPSPAVPTAVAPSEPELPQAQVDTAVGVSG